MVRYCLEQLPDLEDDYEVIVVDGGSRDETVAIARQIESTGRNRVRVLENIKEGRAFQMNAGAQIANGDILLFLHVDCKLDRKALRVITECMRDEDIIGGGFYKKYSTENIPLRLYRAAMNVIRTKWLRNLVGTNAIFVRKKIFFKIGKYPEVPLLEDVMFSDKMKKAGSLKFLKPYVITSSRRYYKSGILKRIWIAYKIMYLYRIRHKAPVELKNIYQQMKK